MIDWSSIVDHIYCIHARQYENRLDELIYELNRVNILNSGIFDLVQVDVYSHFWNGVHDCSFNHVSCMKDAISKGYERILILEDDVRFLTDLNLINYYIENFPKDANLVLLDYVFGFFPHEVERIHILRSDNAYIDFNTLGAVYSAAAYIVDTTMMAHLTSNIEHIDYKCPPDYFTFYRENSIDHDVDIQLRRYVPKYNVAIQKTYMANMRMFARGGDNTYERYAAQGIDLSNYCILI